MKIVLFPWFKRRARETLKRNGVSFDWQRVVAKYLWQFSFLSTDEQQLLGDSIAILLAEKNWEGCNALILTEEMKVVISAQIGLLTLGFEQEYFDRVVSILIYPDAYRAKTRSPAGGGISIESESVRLGEAWYRGPVILSWPDVQAAGQGPNHGHHLVVHEFAHQLDMLNGRLADGIPPMTTDEQARRWQEVGEAAYARLSRECNSGGRPWLDCYGATSRAEFFAVASEAFFQCPAYLVRADQNLFDAFVEFYRQDPRRWS